ncbi:MAG: 4-hydroxy-tetrahydrodipicolinate synthase, partial [Hyphomonadaceae bacterium]|nr:4-hydroxy-tetrahydrodipicolinate synthase [Hyphomonadaceae bacterium]
SQDGLFAHFKAIHDAVDIPIVIYNVPGRTVVDIAVETVGRLSKLANIVGIKDASGDLSRVHRHRELCGEEFMLLSGDDGTGADFCVLGGTGCISVTANAAPQSNARLYATLRQGNVAAARALDEKLALLHKTLFIEPSPAPAKYACSLLGHCAEDVRLPIIPCSPAAKEAVRAAMARAELL